MLRIVVAVSFFRQMKLVRSFRASGRGALSLVLPTAIN